jgi:glycosyltransferase involved in cell wall biosynthesis
MISIFVPTSGRPAHFRDMLKSLRETTFGYDIEVIAVVDADYESFEIAHDFYCDLVDYSPERRGALNSWNTGLELSQGQLLIPAGDDQIFHKNWLKYAIESFQEQLDFYGVLGMNDGAYNGNTQVCTMWMFDRQYCKDHMGGIFAPPMYHYYCIDLEWNEKAKMLNRFYWDERSVVEHLHSAHGKRPVDLLDLEKQDAGWMEEDNRTFEQRKAEGFPVTWNSII